MIRITLKGIGNKNRVKRTSSGLVLLLLPIILTAACQVLEVPEYEVIPPIDGYPSVGSRKLPAEWTPTAQWRQDETATVSPEEPTSTPSEVETSWAETIGYSLEGRPIQVFKFGNGPIERLIVAGIHGGYEWNTIALADELLTYLTLNPEQIPAEVTLYILRALNPDGEAASHGYEGRANSRGVDLNRNWPSDWQADWPREGCWNYLPITAGLYPASEPEVRALMRFIDSHSFDALISYHSAALGIFAGGKPSTEASINLATEIAAVTPYPFPPLQTGCEYSGQFTDWAAAQGIAAVDIELRTHYDLDYEINLKVLKVFLEWRPEGNP
jgi:predicted deacylase